MVTGHRINSITW